MLEYNDRTGMPTIQEAEAFLHEAGELNPGPWYNILCMPVKQHK